MKRSVILFFAFLCGIFASPITQQENVKPTSFSKRCSFGPSYWCHNISTAHECGAMKHCIQTVWEHMKLEADNDDICTICKDMVAQARDQLESNQTQEELKEVFEGSCRLIPVKIIAKECIKVSDEFIPELVEALASQMNPQVVCATAGLCNSARIDHLLAQMNRDQDVQVITSDDPNAKYGKECSSCHKFIDGCLKKLSELSNEQILAKMVKACGYLGSLSSGCHEVVISNFNVIVVHLRQHFNSKEVCDLAGVCKAKHHEHAELNVEVVPRSQLGVRNDETCELCEQLVKHLRDVLVSNTTEEEFRDVLKGICSQTHSFKTQCLNLVNEYYSVFYTFLVNELDPRAVCDFVGICHEELTSSKADGPITLILTARQILPMEPLTLQEAADLFSKNGPDNDEARSYGVEGLVAPNSHGTGYVHVSVTKTGSNIRVIEAEEVLPVGRIMFQTSTLGNKETCTLCQYVLHYIQEQLSSPATEEEIKKVVEGACKVLPSAIRPQCNSFVETYGDAVIALLVQEIDPSQVCTEIGLCRPQLSSSTPTPLEEKDAEIMSNEIPQLPETRLMPQTLVRDDALVQRVLSNAKPKDDNPRCVICEFVMTQLDDMLKDNVTEEEIKTAVHSVCNYLPTSVAKECNDFVYEYADFVIQLLVHELDPKLVCQELSLCQPTSGKVVKPSSLIPVQDSEAVCKLCMLTVDAMDKLLEDGNVEQDIDNLLEKVCTLIPRNERQKCRVLIEEYGPGIALLVAQLADSRDVCSELKLCITPETKARKFGASKCTWGPSYWCQSEFHAMACKATKHCQKMVWKAVKPTRKATKN